MTDRDRSTRLLRERPVMDTHPADIREAVRERYASAARAAASGAYDKARRIDAGAGPCRTGCGPTAADDDGGRLRPMWQQKMPFCGMLSARATGLEPATSGVTGRSWCFRRERG